MKKMTAIALLATIGCTALAMDQPDPGQEFMIRAQKIGRETTRNFIEILEKDSQGEDKEGQLEGLKELNAHLFETDLSEEIISCLVENYPKIYDSIVRDLANIETNKIDATQNNEGSIFPKKVYENLGKMTLVNCIMKEAKNKGDREIELLVQQTREEYFRCLKQSLLDVGNVEADDEDGFLGFDGSEEGPDCLQ